MKDMLGDRMKEYENEYRIYLERRMPVIVRIDGRSFHNFTRGLRRPFDDVLIKAMQDTAKYLCENIAGCKLAYTQSDEISLLLVDYDKPETQAWFGGNLQKIASVSASMATMEFNRIFGQDAVTDDEAYAQTLRNKWGVATFDARAFTLPDVEVCNYFIWRQNDAMRNSVNMVAMERFPHKLLEGMATSRRIVRLGEEGIYWDNLPTVYKCGSCVRRVAIKMLAPSSDEVVVRHQWRVDKDIPRFAEDRSYIDKHVYVGGNCDE